MMHIKKYQIVKVWYKLIVLMQSLVSFMCKLISIDQGFPNLSWDPLLNFIIHDPPV